MGYAVIGQWHLTVVTHPSPTALHPLTDASLARPSGPPRSVTVLAPTRIGSCTRTMASSTRTEAEPEIEAATFLLAPTTRAATTCEPAATSSRLMELRTCGTRKGTRLPSTLRKPFKHVALRTRPRHASCSMH